MCLWIYVRLNGDIHAKDTRHTMSVMLYFIWNIRTKDNNETDKLFWY